jgi:hypothetical protein
MFVINPLQVSLRGLFTFRMRKVNKPQVKRFRKNFRSLIFLIHSSIEVTKETIELDYVMFVVIKIRYNVSERNIV